MASRLFFDPLVALRVSPLVSATCTLLYASDQYFFLGILSRPEIQEHSKPLLPSYFKYFFYRATPFVVGLLAITTSTSIANIYTQRPASFGWYMAGAVLAVGHFLFVPAIAPSCKALIEAEGSPNTDVHRILDEWRAINWIRGLTVDLGAWAALAIAVTKTLQA